MLKSIPITIAYGDGIGPEIMKAVLEILEAAKAPLTYEVIEVGQHLYEQGISSGIKDDAWESLERTKVLLKAPITTPRGSGVKSLNVTLRNMLGLYANIRPCRSYNPFVRATHPDMDVVIIRENEEDVYGGIEHRQTDEMVQCLKLISKPGCSRIIHFAFEYAKAYGRKKVTCFTKDNIMKLSDGLFHQTFLEIAPLYPSIQADHMIVDIGTAKLADAPEQFDVIVVPNLYGDILSDVAAEIAGSVGLAGSANIGDCCAMFEAIHGSAPDIAGQNKANPSGLLMAAIMMLVHLGLPDLASIIQNSWLKTLEEGIFTPDIFNPAFAKEPVTTSRFAQEVIQRLGKEPSRLSPIHYPAPMAHFFQGKSYERPAKQAKRELVGVDLFFYHHPQDLASLVKRLQQTAPSAFNLQMITNRGATVWPKAQLHTFLTDHWRARFLGVHGSVTMDEILTLMCQIKEQQLDLIKMETLYAFDGKPGFSKGQGE